MPGCLDRIDLQPKPRAGQGDLAVPDEVILGHLVDRSPRGVEQAAAGAGQHFRGRVQEAVVVLVVEDDPLLRAEVPVDRRGGHLGFLGHLFDGHGREAALGEQRQGGFLYPPHGREFFSLSQGKLGHGHLLVTTSLA